MQRTGRVLPATELLAIGPRGRDLEGLEAAQLDEPAQRLGVFNSQTFDRAFAADVVRARKSLAIFSGFVSRYRVMELKAMLQDAVQNNIKIRCVTKPPHKNFPRDPSSGARAFADLESINCVVDGRSRIHEKVVIIDGRIVWHGSLNVLSFSQLTDELMTRTVSVEVARSVAVMLAKRFVEPQKILEVVANAENPRCGLCGSRSFYDESKTANAFICEHRCGWEQVLSGSPHTKQRGRRRPDNDEARYDDTRSGVQRQPISLEYLKTAARPYRKFGPPCPRCDSRTVLRLNQEDIHFYGCTRFPHDGCRGSWSIEAELAAAKGGTGRSTPQ
jgi:hypothetical protein